MAPFSLLACPRRKRSRRHHLQPPRPRRSEGSRRRSSPLLVNRIVDFPARRESFARPRRPARKSWAAGVIIERSEEARKRWRVAGSGRVLRQGLLGPSSGAVLQVRRRPVRSVRAGTVHTCRDSKWSVPEPELAPEISPALKLVGYHDRQRHELLRDIEGENPPGLPAGEVPRRSALRRPVRRLAADMPALRCPWRSRC